MGHKILLHPMLPLHLDSLMAIAQRVHFLQVAGSLLLGGSPQLWRNQLRILLTAAVPAVLTTAVPVTATPAATRPAGTAKDASVPSAPIDVSEANNDPAGTEAP